MIAYAFCAIMWFIFAYLVSLFFSGVIMEIFFKNISNYDELMTMIGRTIILVILVSVYNNNDGDICGAFSSSSSDDGEVMEWTGKTMR